MAGRSPATYESSDGLRATWFAGEGVGTGLGVGVGDGVGVAVGTGVAVGLAPGGVGVDEPPAPPIVRGSKLLSMGSDGLKALAIDCQGTNL